MVRDVERQFSPAACLSTLLTRLGTREPNSMRTKISTKPKKIKAILGFAGVSDADLLKQFDAILAGMTGNAAFPAPPVDMAAFKAALDSYSTLTTDALDGGKKAKSANKKQREVVVKMATQLGHYVETASNNDLPTFNISGFVRQRTRRLRRSR